MQSKSDLRRKFRARLSEATAADPSALAHGALSEKLVGFLAAQGGTWASYQPTGMEADIRNAMSELDGISWAFPRVEGESMVFFTVEDGRENHGFSLNKWGILEPDPAHAKKVALEEIEGLLVPGLAFDRKCNRLGKGGGFYDRFFSQLQATKSQALKIGVALDCQIADQDLPVEPFDVPMDWVVTESRCFKHGIGDSSCHPDGLSERKSS